MGNSYTISELADFFNVSSQALRYYDKIGLMKPSSVNPKTGYRYYSEEQLDDLYLIKSLKEMGLTLEEIKDYLMNKDIEQLERILKGKIRSIEDELRLLTAMKSSAEFMLGKIKLTKHVYQENSYEMKLLEPRTAYLIELHFEMKDLYKYIDILYNSYSNSQEHGHYQDHGRIVVTIQKENLQKHRFQFYNGIGFLMNKPPTGRNYVELKGGRYAVTYHIGSYATIHNTYKKLFAYTQQMGYVISGPSAEISIIDNAYTNNPSEYITEIQFPIDEPT